MPDKFEIPIKGEDGYQYTSIRIKSSTLEALDNLADKSNRSRNELISMMLEYCIENAVVTGEESDKQGPG